MRVQFRAYFSLRFDRVQGYRVHAVPARATIVGTVIGSNSVLRTTLLVWSTYLYGAFKFNSFEAGLHSSNDYPIHSRPRHLHNIIGIHSYHLLSKELTVLFRMRGLNRERLFLYFELIETFEVLAGCKTCFVLRHLRLLNQPQLNPSIGQPVGICDVSPPCSVIRPCAHHLAQSYSL